MEKEFLARCLADGLSLREIGEIVERNPSTVGYWVRKHGLRAAHTDRFARRGAIPKGVLKALIDEGASLREISGELDRSVATIRYWLKKYGMTATRTRKSRLPALRAREAGLEQVELECPRHGRSEFVLESRGYYRCARCRREAVSRWRRNAKRRLVRTAGGACAVCGYDNYQGALQFHHPDPESKRFPVSRGGVTRSFAELSEEAAGCVLLCANCHAEVEAGLIVLPAPDRDARVRGG